MEICLKACDISMVSILRQRTGHLFQGRFKGIIVDKDCYLLELTRYVVLNPVRAGMARQPGNWPWSSHRAMIGKTLAPAWLATDGILALFAKRRTTAQQRYQGFVKQGIKSASIWDELQQQIYLGDEKFVKRIQRKAGIQGDELSIPQAQRRAPAPALAKIVAKHHERNNANGTKLSPSDTGAM